ncbi:Carboxy-terminal domain (CTD) phosphatase [Gryganskiella cystojenkinii]|nr:Carboxy-terminal domain (CTD) phosphatase [Gryganskiella cystojenkinii]
MFSSNNIQYRIPAGRTPATIIAVKTQVNKNNSEGDDLIEYEYTERVEGFQDDGEISVLSRRGEIRAIKDGTVEKISIAKGDVIDSEETVLMVYQGCDHDTQYEGMCTECGKTDVPINKKSQVNMTHDATNLTVSQNEAQRLEKETMNRLLEEGKLSLIVDLDQTLIHATVGAAIDEWMNAQGEMPRDIRMFPLPDAATPYYIKLRPHLEDFLKKISRLYELHIYTMGTRKYADAVANAIDPDGKYFGGRILSRDENSSMTKKSISRLFPCSKSMVVIIDDRADVWGSSPNLVNVHPYEYFVGTGDINAGMLPKQQPLIKSEPVSAEEITRSDETKSDEIKVEETKKEPAEAASSSTSAAPALTEPNKDITKDDASSAKAKSEALSSAPTPAKIKKPVLDDNDDELRRVLEILENIHEEFYDARERFQQGESRKDAAVETIMGKMKNSVLQGVNILFSGVIPQGDVQEKAEIWRRAVTFGAECSTDLNRHVTHVVAAKAGTGKVTQARRQGNVTIVRPEWLYHSTGRWQRQDENEYLLFEQRPSKSQQQRSTTPPMPPPGVETVATDTDAGMTSADETRTEDERGVAEGMDENNEPLSEYSLQTSHQLKDVDWSDMGKEIEDELGSDLDETDIDSDTSNTQSDASTDGNRSPLVNLKRARVPTKSRLAQAVSYGHEDDDDEDIDDAKIGLVGKSGELEGLDDFERDSDGDIVNESGSDSGDLEEDDYEEDEDDGDEDNESDTGSDVRSQKRRRLDSHKTAVNGGGRGEDSDADDETTMDYSKGNGQTVAAASSDEEADDMDGDFDEEDFLQDLENELNEDDGDVSES